MNNTVPRFFFGCILTDAQGDRILGIKTELVATLGRRIAEESYEGAKENFRCVLGNDYTHDFDGDLFMIGAFLQNDEDAEGRERIQQHLVNSLSNDRFNASRLCLFRLSYGENGEVESYEKHRRSRRKGEGGLRSVGGGSEHVGHPARRYFEDSHAIAKRLAEAEPGDRYLARDLAVSYSELGERAQSEGRLDEARRYFEDSLPIRKRLVEAESCWMHLADLSVSYSKLGSLAQSEGRLDEARRYFEDSLGIFKRLVEAQPGEAVLARDLCASYIALGNLAQSEGRLDEARRYFEDSLPILKRLVEAKPECSNLACGLAESLARLVQIDLNHGFRDAGRAREAVRWARKAKAFEPSPDSANISETLGDALCTLARCLEGDEAAAIWTEGIAALRRAVEGDVSYAASLASHLRAYAASRPS